METNITYNFDAFEKASEMMRKCVTALSEKNARQQIAAMVMQGMLSFDSYQNAETIAKSAVYYTDALIAELNKKKDGSK